MTDEEPATIEEFVKHLVGVAQARVDEFEDAAETAYYVTQEETTIWESRPVEILDELGTDVPREYKDYIGTIVECEGKPKYAGPETVLEAMALRKLEQTVYEHLADQ